MRFHTLDKKEVKRAPFYMILFDYKMSPQVFTVLNYTLLATESLHSFYILLEPISRAFSLNLIRAQIKNRLMFAGRVRH